MKKRLLLFLLLFSGACALNAQKSAPELIKQVVDKTREQKNIRIDFVYSMINQKAGINESKKGTLYMNEESYKITLAGQMVISDGTTVWTFIEDANEVMVTNAGDGDEAMTPSKLLTSYYKDYKSSFVNDKENTSRGLKTIELQPTSGKKFSKMLLGINESKLQLNKLQVFDNAGNIFIYDLSNMSSGNQLAADFFKFNATQFPGVEVVDMR